MMGAGSTLGLATKDLLHEWILTLCMVLALATILTPLLLLLGLKNGTIQTLKGRLVEDPVYRELKPQRAMNLQQSWFDALAKRPEVAFVSPTILRGSSIVRLQAATRREGMDMLPTGPGDPLLLENGGVIPQKGQAVLSTEAAVRLKVQTGDPVTLRAARTYKGRRQEAKQSLQVVAILEPRADALPRVYVPLQLAVDVEQYREGLAVPERGWSGGRPVPYQSFDGIYLVAMKPVPMMLLRRLTIGTGFSQLEALSEARFNALVGLPVPEGAKLYHLHVLKQPVQKSALAMVRDKLRGRGTIILPYAHVGDLVLDRHGQRSQRPVTALSLTPTEAAQLGIQTPWNRGGLMGLLLPEDLGISSGTIAVQMTQGASLPPFQLQVMGTTRLQRAIIPVDLAGTLRTGQQRSIRFDGVQAGFALDRGGFHGFRLYTKSIEDVAGLYRLLQDQGVETLAKVQAIERIRTLDRGLNRIFWLIAVVSILGGLAALVASLYASVDRKKRAIAMMRLLGLTRRQVFWFPLHQAILVAALSALLAVSGFYLLAGIINHVFAADLALGERICALTPFMVTSAVVIMIAAAAVSALVAAWRTTRIEPAEAIRVE
ncbi:FtsX-like permease family protein [Magnetococcus sp. PR-3]|uniref:FtsX-like permease family protein n=1 Tax=Magnetococcus sp. PR-3 TaxID=3120355 RepID=UPI002FCE4D33